MFEILMDPLGMMVITFVGACLVGVTGTVFIFLTKNEKLKKFLLYFLAVCGILLSIMNVMSTPFISEQYAKAFIGSLGIIGILTHIFWKNPKSFNVARVLVVACMLLSVLGNLV